ncbi:MAG: peptidoglycan bridge formation glycyltransferase FemA/FemB family protein [Treponema sp.]|nr:peptidoglycan bridge formation glycyltransferase FemA/FemB family protein [Treponema sp.]
MVTIQQVRPEDFPVQDNLFQTAFWGTFKNTCGQQSFFFTVLYSDKDISFQFPFMVLIRFRRDGSCYAYAPRAPSVSIAPEKQGILLEEIGVAVKSVFPAQCICLRYDLAWKSLNHSDTTVLPENEQIIMNWGTKTHNLRKAPGNYICPDTVIINISAAPEQILSHMRTTTRNCIRRAYRSKIEFAVKGAEALPDWYSLYQSTALRKNFFYEKEQYFDRLFSHKHVQSNAVHEPPPREKIIPLDAPAPAPQFRIMTAEKDKKIISGIIIALSGHNAYYMYAGSSLEQRELMPNYGLQWEAVRFARSRGCTSYDLMGIPPNNNTADSMAGLYIFKTGFGGEKVRFAGAWDFIYDTDRYKYFVLEDQMKLKSDRNSL